jgi:hypothetical protein
MQGRAVEPSAFHFALKAASLHFHSHICKSTAREGLMAAHDAPKADANEVL